MPSMARLSEPLPPIRILVADQAEAEARFAQAVSAYWHDCELFPARDADTAWAQFGETSPDLVVLDAQLPGDQRFGLLARLRDRSDGPMVVTARAATDLTELQAFAAGADDFLRQPYSERLLLARLQALLRRTQRALPARVSPDFELGGLAVWYRPPRVSLEGRTVPLTPLEYRVLRALTRWPGRVLPTGLIIREAWGVEGAASLPDLKVILSRVRQKIDPAHTRIRTHRGIGYELVRPTPTPAPA